MKKPLLFALFAVSLFLFNACGSGDGKDWPAFYKKQLLAEYESFQKETSVQQHLALIDACKEMSIEDCKKDVFINELLEAQKPAMGPNNNSIFSYVSADLEEEENLLKFTHEITLKHLRQAIELPFDSMPSSFGPNTTGILNFKNAKTDLLNEIKRNNYIVVFRTTSKILPMNYDQEFIPGRYRGRILVYDSKSKELLANMDVSATNSDEIIVYTSNKSQGVQTDFTTRINEAYLSTLQTKFWAVNIPLLSNYYLSQ